MWGARAPTAPSTTPTARSSGRPTNRTTCPSRIRDGRSRIRERGRPVRPAMIWMDRRAEDQAAAVAERITPAAFYGAVGANLDSSHAVFKALWIRDEEPASR